MRKKHLYTIGHSNRALADFLKMLKAYKIKYLVDVRTVPKSRWVPWTNQTALADELKKEKIIYIHLSALGGRRAAQKGSVNTGWKNSMFRGYADHMQTTEFDEGLTALNKLIDAGKPVAIMCAEALPWKCHRSMIADAETVRGIAVTHIMSETATRPHVLTDFAVVDKRKKPIKIIYPDKQLNLSSL